MTRVDRVAERLEERLRRAWTGRPGPLLRGAAALVGTAAELRHFLYDAGVLAARRAPLPVLSVGGLTVGGSGKTPIAAAIARWLCEAGARPAVLTRGFADELALHRALVPEAVVLGGPCRWAAAREAADRGAEVVVLDDGFQHRALARDLDLVVVDADAVSRTNGGRFPAGPFRERFGAVVRAGGVIVSRRAPEPGPAGRIWRGLARRLDDRPVACCALRAGPLVPANGAAAAVPEPDPALAVAGVMKPRLFFRDVRSRWPGVERFRSFRDHRGPEGESLRVIARAAGPRGLVCTRKDAVGLARRLGEEVPVWYVAETVAWEAGEEQLRAHISALLVGRPPGGPRSGRG